MNSVHVLEILFSEFFYILITLTRDSATLPTTIAVKKVALGSLNAMVGTSVSRFPEVSRPEIYIII